MRHIKITECRWLIFLHFVSDYSQEHFGIAWFLERAVAADSMNVYIRGRKPADIAQQVYGNIGISLADFSHKPNPRIDLFHHDIGQDETRFALIEEPHCLASGLRGKDLKSARF